VALAECSAYEKYKQTDYVLEKLFRF
jgi:hypothetical protein